MGFFSKSDFSIQTERIACLLTLKDGRLVSSSKNGKFIIYSEALSGIDLSINHEYSIDTFIQLNNGNLILYSNSKCIMEIIELNNKNQYKIIQVIKIEDIYGSDFREYFKVIETKENELIAIYINGRHTSKQMTI